MATVRMSAQELATVAWFLEAAVVSLKENLEEAEEEGMEDAARARHLYLLEGLRKSLQEGLRSEDGEGEHWVELDPGQLGLLERLAGDALALCRGEKPGTDLDGMGTPPDAAALASILSGVRDRLRTHPQFPDQPA